MKIARAGTRNGVLGSAADCIAVSAPEIRRRIGQSRVAEDVRRGRFNDKRKVRWHGTLRAGSEVEVDPVLDPLRLGHGHEAQAGRRILIRADDDLALPLRQDPPAENLGPEPRQPW